MLLRTPRAGVTPPDPAPSYEVNPDALRAALNAVQHHAFQPIALTLVVLYVVFAPLHRFTLPPDIASIMAPLAAVSAVVAALLWLYVRRLDPADDRIHVLSAALAGIALLNSLAHLYFTGDPLQTTNLLLIIVGSGYLFLRTIWLVAVLVVASASWALALGLLPASPHGLHFGIAMAEASIISVLLHLLRVRLTTRAERMHLLDVQRSADLELARDQAEQMARLKSAFLASMSHEIRTPLTSILGFADVLREESDGETRHLANIIHHSGRRLLDTLNSILDLARLEAGHETLRFERLDLATEVAPVVDLLQPLAQKKNLTLRVEIAVPEAPAWADRSALARVLNNLVGNAIKFTRDGEVVVRVDATDREARLVVSDTGEGIAPEFLPYLFDEFRQESSGMGRSHEGSGLGLAITRHLVDLMNGTIHVESEKGTGSTFTVALPRDAAPAVMPE